MSFSVTNTQSNEAPVTYDEALLQITKLASTSIRNHNSCIPVRHEALLHEKRVMIKADGDSVTLLESVGYRSSRTLCAPHSTPRTDTSAMDGFAVNAKATTMASEDCPVRLLIVDSIAAGDDDSTIAIGFGSHESHNICVEIMTGARFPEHKLPTLDSVVKIEDVILGTYCSQDGSCLSRYIQLNKPVESFQHRRPAGSDFTKGQVVVESGTIFQPKHVAALASLGYTRVAILAHADDEKPRASSSEAKSFLRVGVLSTGSEIVESLDRVVQLGAQDIYLKQTVPDSNGPYMVSSLRSAFPSISVEQLGIVRDDEEELSMRLKKAICEDDFDVVITSGGVSKGRYDLVRHVIENRLQGRVIFHGVKIRPGAPVLFASFDHLDKTRSGASRRRTAFFGAPGNPLATAVALRFFIVPFLLKASAADVDQIRSHSERAMVSPTRGQSKDNPMYSQPLYQKPRDTTVFKLARRQAAAVGHVQVVEDQASYKLKGLLEADCWFTIPAGLREVVYGDQLVLSPL